MSVLVAVGPCRDTAAIDVAAAATSSSPSNAVPFLLRSRPRRHDPLVIFSIVVLPVYIWVVLE